jgi:transketolase
VRVRVSVEAGVAQGWPKYVGEAGESVSIEHYGASAPYAVLYEQFGITPDRVVAAVRASLSNIGATKGSTTGN